jgi:hypothetical protein
MSYQTLVKLFDDYKNTEEATLYIKYNLMDLSDKSKDSDRQSVMREANARHKFFLGELTRVYQTKYTNDNQKAGALSLVNNKYKNNSIRVSFPQIALSQSETPDVGLKDESMHKSRMVEDYDLLRPSKFVDIYGLDFDPFNLILKATELKDIPATFKKIKKQLTQFKKPSVAFPFASPSTTGLKTSARSGPVTRAGGACISGGGQATLKVSSNNPRIQKMYGYLVSYYNVLMNNTKKTANVRPIMERRTGEINKLIKELGPQIKSSKGVSREKNQNKFKQKFNHQIISAISELKSVVSTGF